MDTADAVAMAGAVSLEKIKSDIVTGTLDTLNSTAAKKKTNSMQQTYDLSKKVLSSYYEGKGTLVDTASSGSGTSPGQTISTLISGV